MDNLLAVKVLETKSNLMHLALGVYRQVIILIEFHLPNLISLASIRRCSSYRPLTST